MSPTASLLVIAVIILTAVIFALAALRTSDDDQETQPIARYTQHGCIVRGTLTKGTQRPNN